MRCSLAAMPVLDRTANAAERRRSLDTSPRRSRELRTIVAVVSVYCRGNHRRHAELCSGCVELTEYARKRLERCPFQDRKPTCATCPIHCYQPRIREQVRAVMRYSGPRLLWRHPILMLRHWLDERKPLSPFGTVAPERSGTAG